MDGVILHQQVLLYLLYLECLVCLPYQISLYSIKITSILGNLLTIVALLKSEKLRRHATTSFLLSLTFSDLLFCAISMPMTSVRYFNKAWTFGDALCKVFPFIFYSNIAVSMLSMILMTLNRYILITFQHLYQKFYKCKYICLQLALAWGLAFLIMVSKLLNCN